jgi:hypothetical protein
MSAQFAIRYNGAGVRTNGDTVILGLPSEVDVFVSEADAWHKAHTLGLNPDKLVVVNLHTEGRKP